ncbi:LLM class F420-dependent oxidoreductase [Dictyobacter alpinus]|uniref:LLM class F420-dependent oxidoreductase n=1 Tax=Dictyobacter alpinus TaxID=2014873 RepID=A0A402B0L1_9CHLR|nr:LLM class flavin-dependent oxidoreductase [Dictyobacter alpinus]GCE24891.1 LLM class F420-dependent oxidoreductase [Dictyobacter alpinus]
MVAVEFGLMLRQNDPGHSLQEVIEFNRRCIAELKAGFTTLWLEDHLQVGVTEELECLSTLSYLAAQYPQFKIGSLVLSQSYRNPALLAKMAANLQVLTGGRLVLGLGAGWKEDEYKAYNYPFPAVKTRMEQLEDAIHILRALWSPEQPVTYEGKHYQIHDAYCAPQPEPAIPLLIGGGGEQRTLEIVARYADWWNFNSCTHEEYGRKLDILRQHCAKVGRNFSDIQLSYLSTISVSDDPAKIKRHPDKHFIAGTPDEVIQELQQFRAIGVSHFMFRILDVESLRHFATHVVPHFL